MPKRLSALPLRPAVRSRSEERLEAYLRATTDAVYVMSPDWSEMRQLSGSGFLADTPNPNVSWLEPYIPQEARATVLSAIQQAIRTGTTFQLEHPVHRQDGTVAWTLSRAVPLENESGEITEWIGAATDITALRQNDELRSALRERDALLQEVHHRVKNNLQVISSLLELQAQQSGDLATAALFEEACNRVGSIAVIHEMLYRAEDFATVDLGAYSRRLVPFLVAFYKTAGQVELSIEGADVRLALDQAVPFGLMLNELVSNACKHAFSGVPGRLTVRFELLSGSFRLSVEDTGPGLPEGFSSAERSTLGLKLVQTLVEQLKGSIHFHSDGGCHVDVTIPLPDVTA